MDFFRRIFKTPSELSDTPDQSQEVTPAVDLTPTAETAEADTTVATDEAAGKDQLVDTLPQRPDLPPAVLEAMMNMKSAPPTSVDTPPAYGAGVTRPLPAEPPTVLRPSSGQLVIGQTTNQGSVRENNQDAAFSIFFRSNSADQHPDFAFIVVADGMGGHHDGEKASALTTRTVAEQIISKVYMPLIRSEDMYDADRPTIAEILVQAVKKANTEVLKRVPDGGTTVTAVIVMGNMSHIAHVGDSRAYLILNGELEQLTRDHSVVQRLIELNQITPEESLEHPNRNVLYRAIGQGADLEIDTLTRRLPLGSQVLLCSDGLWSLVPEKEILRTIVNSQMPQEACDKLIELANAYGGHDNITAILLKVPSM